MIVKLEDLMSIYDKEVKKNTKNKRKIYRFEMFKMQNLISIYNKLLDDEYKQGKYNMFMIRSLQFRLESK